MCWGECKNSSEYIISMVNKLPTILGKASTLCEMDIYTIQMGLLEYKCYWTLTDTIKREQEVGGFPGQTHIGTLS